MDLAGADLHRITQTAADEWAPAWSPDGAFLAFSRPVDPLPSQIHVVRPDGTDERTITSLLGAATGPVWSPTGTEIVFGGPAQLYVVRPDSTGLARLTHGPPASWPSWGPPDPES
jgi:TolB protein